MLALEQLRHGTAERIERVRKQKSKARKKLEARKANEVRRVEQRYQVEIDAQDTEFRRREAIENEGYTRRASKELLLGLEGSSTALELVSSICDIPRESMDKARTIYRRFKVIQDENLRTALMETIGDIADPQIKRALEVISQGNDCPGGEIVSYISSSANGVSILIPVRQNESVALARNLEARVDSIISLSKIDSRRAKTIPSANGTPIGSERGLIEFELEDDNFYNGFYFCTISPKVKSETGQLEVELRSKLIELQPEGFREAGLTHVVEVVEPEVLTFFRTHSGPGMSAPRDTLVEYLDSGTAEISYEFAASLTERSIKSIIGLVNSGRVQAGQEGNVEINSLINYLDNVEEPTKKSRPSNNAQSRGLRFSSTNPAEIKEEADQRMRELAGKGKIKFDSADVAYILGYSDNYSGTISRIAASEEVRSHISVEEAHPHRRLFAPEAIALYISRRQVVGGKWIVSSEYKKR